MIRFNNIPFYSQLSDVEKQSIKDLIILIRRKGIQARREGILALEADIDNIDGNYSFLTEMLRYVVDGISEEDVSIIAINLITTTECSDFEKLKMQISANGALGIQEGINPDILTGMLLSMLGMEVYTEMKPKLLND